MLKRIFDDDNDDDEDDCYGNGYHEDMDNVFVHLFYFFTTY